MSTHVDPTALLMEYLEKADDSKYDSQDQSIYYLIATLIAKIEGIGDQVNDMADESTAFSNVQSDAQNVDRDITRIQQWKINNPNASMTDAMANSEYVADVKAFKDDETKLQNDSDYYDKKCKNAAKYDQDGMSESVDTSNMIWSDTINWRPDGDNKTIGSMISGNDDAGLQAALFYGAATTTTSSGVFNEWLNTGKGGSVNGLKNLENDYGTFIGNLNQQLNVAGTNLQQDNQVGQNFITGMGSMLNIIIQHFGDK